MSWRSCSSSKDRQCYWQCTSDCSPHLCVTCWRSPRTSLKLLLMVEVEVDWRLVGRLPPTTSFWLKPYPRPPPQLSKSDYKVLTATAQLLHLPRTLQQRPAHSKWHSLSYRTHTHTHTLKQFGAMALVRGLLLSPWDRWRRRRSCSWSKVERGARTNWCPCAPKWLFSYFSCRSLSSSSSSL